MKIKPEHLAHMRKEISAISDERISAMRDAIAADGRVKDKAMRLRWDASYRAGLTAWICREVYSYANDDHIDTALRKILKERGF